MVYGPMLFSRKFYVTAYEMKIIFEILALHYFTTSFLLTLINILKSTFLLET